MKARFLGYKSIQAMEGALNSLRWQTSRQKIIDYYQSNSIGNGTGLIALYYLEFNTNIWNYLPSPNFRIGATIKTPKIRQARLKSSTKPQSNTTSIKKSDATSIELNSNQQHSLKRKEIVEPINFKEWNEFNRQMGKGKFTKDKFGGSSIKARIEAFQKWKANRNGG